MRPLSRGAAALAQRAIGARGQRVSAAAVPAHKQTTKAEQEGEEPLDSKQRAQREQSDDLVRDRVYPVPPPTDSNGQLAAYRNADGWRVNDGRYSAFKEEATQIVPKERIVDDQVRTFAYSTDASFYRLEPKMVVKVHNEAEVSELLRLAHKHETPVTFRAAGTSLSGQALTDSVMIKLSHNGRNFRNYQVHNGGQRVTVEPGLIGGEVNKILENHRKKNNLEQQYKIGPDPASLESCMMGGIIANNSSGMCCGVKQNTYHTLQDMRVVLPDGFILDTADPKSRQEFLNTHGTLTAKVSRLAERVQADDELMQLIRRKFSIKNTNGYAINALADISPHNSIELVKRLMIGSEGTLGFVSQATYNTVPDHDHKASSFMLFNNIDDACKGADVLRQNTNVDAVELFDYSSLRQSDEKMLKMVPGLSDAPEGSAGLLIECRGQTEDEMKQNINKVESHLDNANLGFMANRGENYPFISDPEKYMVYWKFRKGLIPIVGGAREKNTVMLLEDVACSTEYLPDMVKDLSDMFSRYGYHDASIFGHALEGNVHTVFNQGFRTNDEIERYCSLMNEMCTIVASKYGGSLKAEHGTGRNVAPFLELEWGSKAYEIMWELKEIFDPAYVLNPGVILNTDPELHSKNLKQMAPASDIVDHCIECGFCESNCPSKDVTLTPRQRITVFREISRLKAKPTRTQAEEQRLREFENEFAYLGENTCAADGMCQVKCPVNINTGELVKHLREEELKEWRNSQSIAQRVANNFSLATTTVSSLFNLVDVFHRILGPTPLEYTSKALNYVSSKYVPVWNPYMPKGAPRIAEPKAPAEKVEGRSAIERKAVYVPSCVTRMMGPARGDSYTESLSEPITNVLSKAGYEVVYPEGLSDQCCGMIFQSRGFAQTASVKHNDLEEELKRVSENGKYPIIMDAAPCLSTTKDSLKSGALQFSLYGPEEFVRNFLTDKLEFEKKHENIHVHVPCSTKKKGNESSFYKLAGMCADEVTPSGIPCCGMAGDRGMRFTELSGGSLQHLDVPSECSNGYSSSKTCEIALSHQSGLHHRGLMYLVDECTRPKRKEESTAATSA